MSISTLLSELNKQQNDAATLHNQNALVLAGAGCGKTKTIVARAAYLIANGTPPQRIQILTFTRRSSSEIVERVRVHLGDAAEGLNASTFHTWCMSLIRKAPNAFGHKSYSVIDKDDQLQLFKAIRGRKNAGELPTAGSMCDMYSFCRNTLQSLSTVLKKQSPEAYCHKSQLAKIMRTYESKKRERHYLDYDDIIDVVAECVLDSPETCSWLAGKYDHLLIDEMQDTNPLQWKLIDSLKTKVTLFCVGDDAQSIYGFRGADFRNVHSFQERVPDSIVLKLKKNYRSTQEILNTANWLLSESPLSYGKSLIAARGNGKQPQLISFEDEWQEGRWIAQDLSSRRAAGADWNQHMILVRSAYSARTVENALLAKEIPYRFIGGTKLLESAHIRDVISVLRLVANYRDEIAWTRFLTLWPGVGDVTAGKSLEEILSKNTLGDCIDEITDMRKIPAIALKVIRLVSKYRNDVSKAFAKAVKLMSENVLAAKYINQEWDKRQKDFVLVEKLAGKHTSILSFIEEYSLNPVHSTQIEHLNSKDVVTIITIHSAKGTESKVCYVVNVSPGAFPSGHSSGNEDDVEEERRVLYVALTRAMDELIVTRKGSSSWATEMKNDSGESIETYFFNDLPDEIFDEHVLGKNSFREFTSPSIASKSKPKRIGIIL